MSPDKAGDNQPRRRFKLRSKEAMLRSVHSSTSILAIILAGVSDIRLRPLTLHICERITYLLLGANSAAQGVAALSAAANLRAAAYCATVAALAASKA